MNSVENMTVKQMAFFAAILTSLIIGVLFWATAVDGTGKIIGAVLMGVGFVLVVPFAMARDRVVADRRFLKSKGRRVEAYVSAVHYDGGMRGVDFYHLELKDLNDETIVFVSDPLLGTGDALRGTLDSNRQQGIEKALIIPVYVDPVNPAHYFVDAPASGAIAKT